MKVVEGTNEPVAIEVRKLYKLAIPLAFVLGLTLVLTGCGGGGGSSTDTSTAPYLPLAVGNEWHYNYLDYSTSAAVKPFAHKRLPARGLMRTAQTSTEDIVKITGTQMIGGSQWYTSIAQYVGGAAQSPVYVRHSNAGLMVKESLTDVGYYLLKSPVIVGTTWGSPFDPNETFSIVSTDATVNVPAGLFHSCVVVKDVLKVSGQPDDTILTWYKYGVGTVAESRTLGTTKVYDLELLNYTLVD